MSRPWSLTRFVRRRVREWAPYFLPCRLPIEEKAEPHPLSPILPITPPQAHTHVSIENGTDTSSAPYFSDEEHIIFGFREDGNYDVVKDRKSEEPNQSTTSLWLLSYAEDSERDYKNISNADEGRSSEDGNEEEIIPFKEGDGEGEGKESSSICLKVELAPGRIRRRRQQEGEEKPNHHRMVSFGSTDSNQSDGSTGSFAFRVFVRTVREWASCFLPCSFPIEEEAEPHHSSPILPSPQVYGHISLEIGTDVLSAPSFSDEEYIAFSFREDGNYDGVEYDSKSEEPNQSTTSLGQVPMKLNYAEDSERDNENSNADEGRSSEDGNEEEIIPFKEGVGDERNSIYLEIDLASGRRRRRRKPEVDEKPNHHRVVSVGSTDSNQSSFAFPVLELEWMESPMPMPKPKSQCKNPRKNKHFFSVPFQCFRLSLSYLTIPGLDLVS